LAERKRPLFLRYPHRQQLDADGEPWKLLNGGATSYYASRIYLTIALSSRKTARFRHAPWGSPLAGRSAAACTFQLEIALRCDFADVFEVKAAHIVRRGRITTEWSEAHQHLRTTYCNRDFTRAVTISPSRSSSKAVYANGRLSFEVALKPGEPWHCCLLSALADGDRHHASPPHCIDYTHKLRHDIDGLARANSERIESRGIPESAWL
jgi:hypothetical protein